MLIYETIIRDRLVDFLNSCNFFYSHQYGFRSTSGTHTATFELVDYMSQKLDLSTSVSGLFIDLSKAFDCVNHSILLEKIAWAGVRGPALDLIKSYLTGRFQCVLIDNCYSEHLPVSCGVPQGSVLGPLLFLVYINDLFRLGISGKPFLYADDSAFFYTGNDFAANVDMIQSDLSILGDFFRINKLSMNVSKTKLIHFRSGRRSPIIPDLVFDGNIIEAVPSVVYLGLSLDCCLAWRTHVSDLCRKLAPVVGILGRLRYYLPTKILRLIYFGLFHSRISYLTGIWGSASACILHQLQVLQNRALRQVHKLNRFHCSTSLYNYDSTRVLNVDSLYCYGICKFVHDSVKSFSFSNTEFRGAAHSYNTRNRHRLTRPKFKNRYGKTSLGFMGPTLYEKIPTHIKNCVSRNLFAKKLKDWLHTEQMQS